LFAERGFDGTPIREIAQQAGSTKALIYHYYRNKEDLYLSLLEAAVSEVVTQVEKIAASGDPPDHKIRGVVEVFLEFYRVHPQRFQMVQRAIDEHSTAATTLAERWFSRAHLALQSIAAEGIKQGTFKLLLPQIVPFVVIGLIIHVLRNYKLIENVDPGFSGNQLLATLADLILILLKADKKEKKKSCGRGNTQSPHKE
jgi:AcrR family transcriptional regulator